MLARILIVALGASSVLLAAPQTASASLSDGTGVVVTVTVEPNDAVNVPGMQYRVAFVTSATGTLNGSSTITLTAAAGTVSSTRSVSRT